MLNDLIDRYRRHISPITAADILYMLARYHRLQGSKGLWDAVKALKEFLDQHGVSSEVIRVEEGSKRGFITAPISWDPVEASLEVKSGDRVIARLDMRDHPTLLSAHSPDGEGCSGLEICRDSRCGGEAVLATGYLYDIYHNIDADLILYYNGNRFRDAVPYIGLFLEPGERERSVVMNIPYNLALHLIHLKEVKGDRINVCWRAKRIRHRLGLPILLSCRGDEPGVVFISHICHPKPGAHDNASGSVVNALISIALGKAGFKHSYCNIWVPEYTGTVHLYDKTPWRPLGVVNIDMVGSKQYVTGSTLTLVNPPRMIRYSLTPIIWLGLRMVMDNNSSFPGFSEPGVRWGVSPYGMGSDHDIYTVWGFEALMLNEWPSKYYHTDRDSPETIDPLNLVRTTLAILLGVDIYYGSDNGLRKRIRSVYEHYLRSIYYSEALKKNVSASMISRYLLKKPLLMEPPEKPLIESPLISRSLYKLLGRERYLSIRKIKGALDALGSYLPLAYVLGVKDPLKRFKAERVIRWSRRDERIVRDSWEIVRDFLG